MLDGSLRGPGTKRPSSGSFLTTGCLLEEDDFLTRVLSDRAIGADSDVALGDLMRSTTREEFSDTCRSREKWTSAHVEV